jgi:glucuronate isomerase
MKKFLDKDFLLTTETAKKLYFDHAAKKPIVDYHCHLIAQEIAENKKFENITQLWLNADHYKWRLMRANGVAEEFITGKASDRDKFQKWAQTLEKAIGNPLYHWSHLELQRYFNYQGDLNGETAQEVWDLCNKKLASSDMSAIEIIKKSAVKLVVTTDDPIDSLKYHVQILDDESFPVKVLPGWRPDKAMGIEKEGYDEYLQLLSQVTAKPINTFAELMAALEYRMVYFKNRGTLTADHGLDFVPYRPATNAEIEKIFAAKLDGEEITQEEIYKFKTAFMLAAAEHYYKAGWVMELHTSCKRDNNSAALRDLGANTGFDAINNFSPMSELADFLNALEANDILPKTIVYSLNPVDDDAINSIVNCFGQEGVKNKVQQGSAWWFNDHKSGMIKQMTAFANGSLLSNFIGMLTDSRSLVSYPRHEYFRRILCEMIGTWVENGEYPADYDRLGKIVEDISYNNAVEFFGFKL